MGRISCPDFIDRVEESRVLDAALQDARAGGTPSIFVGGEAGIGKSRLVSEFSRRAADNDARVLAGGCPPFGRSPLPFAPVVEALRAFTRSAGGAERARLVERVPALAWLLPELAREGVSWRRLEDFESGQSWVFELLLGLLEDVAAQGSLVLVLEDLHWADRSTLDLLAVRVQTSRVPGCVFVATYRSDEVTPGHPLRPLLAELDRSGRTERLELQRFGRAELVDQLTGILGAVPGHDLVEDVAGRSEGNPFLAEELVAARSERREGAPTKVRDIVLARVESLSEPTQAVLRVLSAARRSLAHRALAAVSGMAERDLEDALREAIGAHVLVEAEAGAYAFRHTLMREAIYDGLLISERERLHTELARAIDAHRAMTADASPELLLDLAHHWYCAGDRRRALEAAVRAGLAVDEIYAHAEALTQYERALELWDLVGAPERLTGVDRIDLQVRAAEAASCGGESERAAELIEQALAEVNPAVDPVRAGLMRERLGRYCWIGGRTHQALDAYEDSVRIIPASRPSMERARVLAALGHAQVISNRYRSALARSQEALEVSRAVAARVEEGRALATLGAATAYLGGLREGLRMVRAGRALLERAGAAPDFSFVTYAYEADVLDYWGCWEEAVEAAGAGIALTRRYGLRRNHQTWLEAMVACSLIKLGRWTQAEDVLQAALLRGPTGISLRAVALLRAELKLATGDIVAATESAAAGKRAVRGDQPFARRMYEVMARLATEAGDYDSARASVAHAIAVLEPLDDLQAAARVCWRGLQAEAARAERASARKHISETDEAITIAAGLLDRVRALAAPEAAAPGAEVPALRRTCEAEFARTDGQDATDLWLAAAAAWDAVGERYPRAYCLLHAAESGLVERRPKADATAALSAAYEIASGLGALHLAGAIEHVARRGRIALGPKGDAPVEAVPETTPADRLGLTSREIEVLRLVGHGYTNGQIAHTLFISRKTASAHVSNILGKLGASRRAEAAAIAERLDLLDEPSPEVTT